jgi:hypothetical protein
MVSDMTDANISTVDPKKCVFVEFLTENVNGNLIEYRVGDERPGPQRAGLRPTRGSGCLGRKAGANADPAVDVGKIVSDPAGSGGAIAQAARRRGSAGGLLS